MSTEPVDNRKPRNQTPLAEPLDLNLASFEQLRSVDQIGDNRARAIVDWRDRHGPFVNVEQLRDFDLLPPEVYDAVRGHFKA